MRAAVAMPRFIVARSSGAIRQSTGPNVSRKNAVRLTRPSGRVPTTTPKRASWS
jgi:hypothetical protein